MRITTFYGFRPANLVRSLWIVCRFFLELSPGITSSKGSSFQLCWITYLKIQSTEVCFGLPQTHTVAAPKPFPDGKMFLTKNAPSSLYAGKKKTLEWKSYSSDEFQEIVIHKESFLKPPQKGEKCQQETKSEEPAALLLMSKILHRFGGWSMIGCVSYIQCHAGIRPSTVWNRW